MSERWKPEFDESYWAVDPRNNPAVIKRRMVGDSYSHNHYCNGNCFKTKEDAEAAAEKVKNLLLSLHEEQPTTECSQLPKLTADIFNLPSCPDRVRYAAVNKDGVVWGFVLEPSVFLDRGCWNVANDEYAEVHGIADGFDASDWTNSLVQRVRYTTDGVVHVRFKKLHPDAKAPYQATPGSAGFDLTAVSVEPVKEDDFLCRYGTGLAVEIPQGHVGLVFPRSSVYKAGQLLTNCVGVIDSDYRGEIAAVFAGPHTGSNAYKPGDRIAQLVIMPIPAVKFVEAEELTETERGAGGYGSTGK